MEVIDWPRGTLSSNETWSLEKDIFSISNYAPNIILRQVYQQVQNTWLKTPKVVIHRQ